MDLVRQMRSKPFNDMTKQDLATLKDLSMLYTLQVVEKDSKQENYGTNGRNKPYQHQQSEEIELIPTVTLNN